MSSSLAQPGVATAAHPTTRIESVDIIRGAVMVLMAIDHVRVYSGLPAGGPSPGMFFTRWVTHFCAPAFIFLAGTSAFLSGRKHGNPASLSRHLLVRGAWLVFLELTLLRFAWTFNFDYSHYLLAGVIWVIGWSMILMAGLVRLPIRAVGVIGFVIVAGHNVVDLFLPNIVPALRASSSAWFWQILYFGGPIPLGSTTLMVLYSLIPWIGVMAAGYAFGAVLLKPPAERRRWCLSFGIAAIALFLMLRGFNLYGNPSPWGGAPNGGSGGRTMPPLLSFLNTNKYPASFSFLLMTLGPTILAIPLLEHARGFLARALTTFGRVPFFYYVLHIPLIHLLAIGVSLVRTGQVDPWLFANHPMGNPPAPEGYAWGLGLLYLVWAFAMVVLYFPSRWYAGLKAKGSRPGLSYL